MTAPSELLALKIENYGLRLAQLQAQSKIWIAEQNALIDEARKEVGAPEGHVYNLDTRQFQPPAGVTPFSTTKARQQKRATG